MAESNHEVLRKALKEIPGINFISSMQAEHCGHHYFEFRASENVLEKLLKGLHAVKWLNCHTSVHYDDGLTYRLGVAPYHYEKMLEVLKEIKDGWQVSP